jgi:peroxiredoxin Q/BCP
MSLKGIVRFALSAIGRRGRMLEPGQAAPDFDTADHLGRPVRLRDLRGKRVVLWFFPKADTPG